MNFKQLIATFFAFLFIFSIMVETMKIAGIYAWYYVNIEYITDNYCINIDNPELDCYGKCYLQKIIVEETGNNSPDALSQSLVLNELNYFSQTFRFKILKKPDFIKKEENYFYSFNYDYSFVSSHFRPPWVIFS